VRAYQIGVEAGDGLVVIAARQQRFDFGDEASRVGRRAAL
jgi:hypothetical protein